MTLGYAVGFAGYSSYLYHLYLASHDCNMTEKVAEIKIPNEYLCKVGLEKVKDSWHQPAKCCFDFSQ